MVEGEGEGDCVCRGCLVDMKRRNYKKNNQIDLGRTSCHFTSLNVTRKLRYYTRKKSKTAKQSDGTLDSWSEGRRQRGSRVPDWITLTSRCRTTLSPRIWRTVLTRIDLIEIKVIRLNLSVKKMPNKRKDYANTQINGHSRRSHRT